MTTTATTAPAALSESSALPSVPLTRKVAYRCGYVQYSATDGHVWLLLVQAVPCHPASLQAAERKMKWYEAVCGEWANTIHEAMAWVPLIPLETGKRVSRTVSFYRFCAYGGFISGDFALRRMPWTTEEI